MKEYQEEISRSKHVDIELIERGKSIVYQRQTKKTYLLGMGETMVLEALDKVNSLDALLQEGLPYSANEIKLMLHNFDKYGFLSSSRVVAAKKRPLKLHLYLLNPNSFINTDSIMVRISAWILKYLSIPMLIFGVFILRLNSLEFMNIATNELLSLEHFIYVTVMLGIAVLFHEFGHIVVARKFKISVPEYGIMLYLFLPLFYTRICGTSLIKKKSNRVFILLAGVAMNAFLFGLSQITYLFVEGIVKILVAEFAIGNFALIFINLLLFIKLDGYFILCELFDELQLREKSLSEIVILFQNFRRKEYKQGIDHLKDSSASDMKKLMYYVYGFLSLLFLPIAITISCFTIISFILNYIS